MNHYFLILVLAVYFTGCNSQIRNEIRQMQTEKMNTDTRQMVQMINGKNSIMYFLKNYKLKLVIFTDSTACSSCAMKQMYSWNTYIEKAYESNHMLQLMFVFAPNKNEVEMLIRYNKISVFDYPVYIDTLGIFQKNNPHLPKNPRLHTFLLDANNHVILVGNPLYNTKIKEMYDRVIHEKLSVQ